MANNHGVDYGPDGLPDTLAAKAATPLGVVGIGANATEAYTPWTTVVRGQRISVIGASDVIDDALIGAWTATDTQGGIASAKGANQAAPDRGGAAPRAPSADTLVVVPALGRGRDSSCPTPRQEELAQALVDAGADIVVGSHAHRVETAGRLGTALVDYGLGNFVFYNESGTLGRDRRARRSPRPAATSTAYPGSRRASRAGSPTCSPAPPPTQDVNAFNSRRATCTNLTP